MSNQCTHPVEQVTVVGPAKIYYEGHSGRPHVGEVTHLCQCGALQVALARSAVRVWAASGVLNKAGDTYRVRGSNMPDLLESPRI